VLNTLSLSISVISAASARPPTVTVPASYNRSQRRRAHQGSSRWNGIHPGRRDPGAASCQRWCVCHHRSFGIGGIWYGRRLIADAGRWNFNEDWSKLVQLDRPVDSEDVTKHDLLSNLCQTYWKWSAHIRPEISQSVKQRRMSTNFHSVSVVL